MGVGALRPQLIWMLNFFSLEQIPEQKGGNTQTKGYGGKHKDLIVEDFERLNIVQ